MREVSGVWGGLGLDLVLGGIGDRWYPSIVGTKGRCLVTLAARKVAVKPSNLRLLYPPGTSVELHSLTSSPALNGRTGQCGRFDSVKGRYVVMLDGTPSKGVNVKPANLRRTP